MSIHPTAIVTSGARIGRDVQVGPYSIIGANVQLGDGCKVHHHATIEGHTQLGEGCEVFPQAVIGCQPQDVKYAGEETQLIIGKGNVIREMVTIHPGTANGGGVTTIGDNNLLLIGVHVAHDCTIGNRCIIANYVQFAGHVNMEDHVNMGGHSAVHHFVTIGRHAFVGGMTRITADVPPYMVVVAAKGTRPEVRMVNGVGLERNGFSQSEISELRAAFTRLYSRRARLGGSPILERVQAILDEGPANEHVENLCRFLLRSFAHGRHGRYLESLRQDPVHRSSWKPEQQKDGSLTVEVVGQGTVSRTINGVGDSPAQEYELTAEAEPGWQFAGWNGAMPTAENPIRLVVDGDMTVTATFTRTS